MEQVAYPSLAAPQRVDWVGYARRNEAASPTAIATAISARTTGAVWLVRADNYRTFGNQCGELDEGLDALRGRTVCNAVAKRPVRRAPVAYSLRGPGEISLGSRPACRLR